MRPVCYWETQLNKVPTGASETAEAMNSGRVQPGVSDCRKSTKLRGAPAGASVPADTLGGPFSVW